MISKLQIFRWISTTQRTKTKICAPIILNKSHSLRNPIRTFGFLQLYKSIAAAETVLELKTNQKLSMNFFISQGRIKIRPIFTTQPELSRFSSKLTSIHRKKATNFQVLLTFEIFGRLSGDALRAGHLLYNRMCL